MKIKFHLGNIVDVNSDVLVYSTNLKLLMGGGVGEALLEKYGYGAQKCLYDAFDNSNNEKTKLGDIYDCKTSSMAWTKVLHTIATDEDYVTEPQIVEKIIRDCFGICDLSFGINRISMSALGCGYGDLSHEKFIKILKKVSLEFQNTDLEEVIVVCDNSDNLESMKRVIDIG